MEHHLAEYGHAEGISDKLQQALETRHWPPDTLAQATALPISTVNQHLEGSLEPTAEDLEKYSAALGLSMERLLAAAAVQHQGDARVQKRASLLAIQQLLTEVWDETTAEEREDVLQYVESLSRSVQARSRTS